jgi:hypothetical protein
MLPPMLEWCCNRILAGAAPPAGADASPARDQLHIACMTFVLGVLQNDAYQGRSSGLTGPRDGQQVRRAAARGWSVPAHAFAPAAPSLPAKAWRSTGPLHSLVPNTSADCMPAHVGLGAGGCQQGPGQRGSGGAECLLDCRAAGGSVPSACGRPLPADGQVRGPGHRKLP